MERSILLNDVGEHDGVTYAEPLAGLRVSWGAILAGALAMLAVSLLVWSLAAAIILTATTPSAGAIERSIIALGICSIVTTLIGAFVGGWLAGYLPGNRSSVMGAAHGGLAWALAFVVMAVLTYGSIAGVARTATEATVTAASATAETAGALGGGGAAIDLRARELLVAIGYTPTEATRMVVVAKSTLSRKLHGGAPAEGGADIRTVANHAVNWMAGITWAWFGTWLLAALLAICGGLLSAQMIRPNIRTRSRPAGETRTVTTPPPATTPPPEQAPAT